ncbi:hard surface induced protein [Paramyrothecium foliicola]|nr:hard surface induced protein [Paramyrothecium foliicola]
MGPKFGAESARALDGHELDLLPRSEVEHGVGDGIGGPSAEEKGSASSTSASPGWRRNAADKIRCLDGLRGIACLIVFNYHFFWPWTPAIMLGYGAWPPKSPEPNWEWPTLPILCLLHRGRPMVAIFFAISGYVLCRHIQRAIHERRVEAAYQSLASAAFRRVFRLYIPPTISMFLVAMLAQAGVFRSEDAIYKGPDSAYINGTVTIGRIAPQGRCYNRTAPVFASAGFPGIAEYLDLQSPDYLNITSWNGTLCLNSTSYLFSPASLYTLVDPPPEESAKNGTKGLKKSKSKSGAAKSQAEKDLEAKLEREEKIREEKERLAKQLEEKKSGTLITPVRNVTNGSDVLWVQLGGSWEEHPFIHDNITYALQNFTRAYAEWANPFNFGHYHPRYDPHTFTIPMELRGSMFLYIFLLATAAIKPNWRLGLGGFLSAYSLQLGRWDMATFMGGALLSEMDIRRTSEGRTLVPPATSSRFGQHGLLQPSPSKERALRWFGIFIALFFLSYPDAGAEWTPGFIFLSDWVPRYYIPLSGWMFYQATGALILLVCVLRSPLLCRFLEGRHAQYLGKISFSFYLVHGPVLHSLGFWIMPRLFDQFGKYGGYAVGYVVLLSTSLYLSNWWYKKIDLWSVTVGKRVEKFVKE